MKRKGIWVVVSVLVVLGLLLGGFACAPTPTPAPTTTPTTPTQASPAPVEPIKIGGLFSRSGFFAGGGEDAYRAQVVAFEQVGYEVAGRPIEFIAEDIASDATVTMDKARKLLETDKIDVLIGMTLTAGWDAIGDYLTRMKVPGLASSGLTERQALAGWPVWSHTGPVAQGAHPMGVYAYDVLGYKTVSILTYEAEFAHGYMDEGFIVGFESRGGEVLQAQYVPLDVLDFTPYLIKIVDADALVIFVLGGSGLPAIAQIRELGVWDRMPVIEATASQMFDEYFLDQAGDTSIGIVGQVEWSPYWETEGNQEFIEAAKERWGVTPGIIGGGAYASAQILLNAIERTGGDVSFEALSKALDDTDMETVRGPVTFIDRLGVYEAWIMKHVRTTDPKLEVVAKYQSKARIVGDHIEVFTRRIK